MLLTPPTPEGRDLPSLRLRPKPNPKNLKVFEGVQGQTTTWRKTRRNLFDTHTEKLVVGKVGTRKSVVQISRTAFGRFMLVGGEHV